jgi:hypothetical protein
MGESKLSAAGGTGFKKWKNTPRIILSCQKGQTGRFFKTGTNDEHDNDVRA